MRVFTLILLSLLVVSCGSQIEEPNIIETRPGKGGINRQKAQSLLLDTYVNVINATAQNVVFLTSRAFESEKVNLPKEGISNLKLYGRDGENGFEWEYRRNPDQKDPSSTVKVIITPSRIEYVKDTNQLNETSAPSEVRDVLTLSDLRMSDNRLTGSLTFQSSKDFQNIFKLNTTSFMMEFESVNGKTHISSFESTNFYVDFSKKDDKEHFLNLREGLTFKLDRACRAPTFAPTKVELKMPFDGKAVLGELAHENGRLRLSYKRVFGSRPIPSCEK